MNKDTFVYEGTTFKTGDRIKCKINDLEIPEAAIVIYGNDVFICQNLLRGAVIPDRFEYKFSYVVNKYSIEEQIGITNFKKIVFNIFENIIP